MPDAMVSWQRHHVQRHIHYQSCFLGMFVRCARVMYFGHTVFQSCTKADIGCVSLLRQWNLTRTIYLPLTLAFVMLSE